jgi:hypothetical protein
MGLENGLVTSMTGSVYDVPSTKASSAISGSRFEKTERAVKKLPFKTFYTTNLTDDEGV